MKTIVMLVCVAAMALLGACMRYETNPDGKTLTLARDFISTQPLVLERVGEIKAITEAALEQSGQAGTIFGWFYREQENWVLRVAGNKEVLFVRVSMARRGSNPNWEVTNWGILPKSETAQYETTRTIRQPAAGSDAAPAPPAVIGY